MMKNINRSTSFDDYCAEPSSSVWTKIEKRLPPPRGKKSGWWIWGMAALLLSGVFVASYFFDIEIKPTLKRRKFKLKKIKLSLRRKQFLRK